MEIRSFQAPRHLRFRPDRRARSCVDGRRDRVNGVRRVAICQMLPQGSSTIARRSPYGMSPGISIDRAPAAIARRYAASALSTYTYRNAVDGPRTLSSFTMMIESPIRSSEGRSSRYAPVARNTRLTKVTSPFGSRAKSRGVTNGQSGGANVARRLSVIWRATDARRWRRRSPTRPYPPARPSTAWRYRSSPSPGTPP